MGTRSLTVFGKGVDEIVVMYRQMDGYPTGHGQELAEFLDGFTVVNGYSFADNRKIANGLNCLAAQVIAHFKNGVGGFYLYPANTRDCWEEYIYIVSEKNSAPYIEVIDTYDNGNFLFKGTPRKMLNWIRNASRHSIRDSKGRFCKAT